MGRAQVVQAEACGIAPHTDMNPVLLKPTNDKSSQVVLNGKPVGNMSAKDYFGIQNQKEALFKEAIEAFNRLESRYNPIVLEGAGKHLRTKPARPRYHQHADGDTGKRLHLPGCRYRPRRCIRFGLRYYHTAQTRRTGTK